MRSSGFQTVLVVGDNYKDILFPYSMGNKVDKYLKYKRSDAGKMRKKTVSIYKSLLDNANTIEGISVDEIKKLYQKYKNMSDFEYYQEITKGCIFEDDSLDAYSTDNPNAKFDKCVVDCKYNNFALPFILKDGTETYQAKKKDIDWSKIHMYNTFPYERAWEMVVDGDEPNDDDERNIYENMKNRTEYFNNFSSKEEYVAYSCSFWEYAYVDEKQGWINLDYTVTDFDWVSNFYKRFIEPLPEDAVLTIVEYRDID